MAITITDIDATYIEYDNGFDNPLLIKKAYIEMSVSEPILTLRWHKDELEKGRRLVDIDFNDVTSPVVASAAALKTAIDAMIASGFGGSVANASETVKGIVEEATQAETNTYTDTGTTGAKLFIVPSKVKVWIEQAALTIDAVWHFVTAKLRLFNAGNTFYIEFQSSPTANRTQTFQDATGTIALTSDIPSGYTDEQAQDAVGGAFDNTTLEYIDATPLYQVKDSGISTAKIADDAVTYAKMQNVSATDKLLGRSTAGAGNVEEIDCTAAGRAILDDTTAAAQRTTLGLGSVAVKDYSETVDAAIASTITWTAGTAPSGASDLRYSWIQIGRLVHFQFRLEYAVAGLTVTQLAIAKPSDMPNPASITGWGNNEGGIACDAEVYTSMATAPSAARGQIDKDVSGNFQFRMASASLSTIGCTLTGTYVTA